MKTEQIVKMIERSDELDLLLYTKLLAGLNRVQELVEKNQQLTEATRRDLKHLGVKC